MAMNRKDFPNLSNLSQFINVRMMQAYPKFTVLSFESLIDYMPIFENRFVSIFKQIKAMIPAGLKEFTASKQSKQLKLNDMGGAEREEVVNFFTKNYKANLEAGSKEKAKLNLGLEDGG